MIVLARVFYGQYWREWYFRARNNVQDIRPHRPAKISSVQIMSVSKRYFAYIHANFLYHCLCCTRLESRWVKHHLEVSGFRDSIAAEQKTTWEYMHPAISLQSMVNWAGNAYIYLPITKCSKWLCKEFERESGIFAS